MVAAEKKTTKESKKLKAAEKRAMKKAWKEKLKKTAYDAESWMEQAEIVTAMQSNSMIYLNKYEREFLRGIRKEVAYDDRLLACPRCEQLSRYHRHDSTIKPSKVEGKLRFIITLYCKCMKCGYAWDTNPTDITL
jgi:rubrerythrin